MNRSISGIWEGAFASPVLGQNLETLAPYASGLSGAGSFVAGPGGVLQGRFGYADPSTGQVLNSQTSAADAFGVVVPLQSVNAANGGVIGGPQSLGGPWARWTWQTWDPANKAWRLRAGLMANLMPSGNFWLKFPNGANYGDIVYASITDGTAQSGVTADAVETLFRVIDNAQPNNLARVSSTARFY